MPNPTYKAIATTTIGAGGASTIDFSSIPSTYTDLQILVSARGTNASYVNFYVGIKFNNVTTNLTSRVLLGSGSSAFSFSDTKIYVPVSGGNATSNSFGSAQFYIPNYAGSAYKSLLAEGVSETNGTAVDMYLTGGLWSSTAAINQITLYDPFSYHNFAQYSTATLYGISKS